MLKASERLPFVLWTRLDNNDLHVCVKKAMTVRYSSSLHRLQACQRMLARALSSATPHAARAPRFIGRIT